MDNYLISGFIDVCTRMGFFFLTILVYRIGVHIPIQGIDHISIMFRENQMPILSLFNIFSGGAIDNISILSLGIMPYISASIIMQIITLVVPKLQKLKKENTFFYKEAIIQYTRYITVLLSIFQAIVMIIVLVISGMVSHPCFKFYFINITTLVAGAIFIMWLCEQINEQGIGNGVSLIILTGIVSGITKSIGKIIYIAKLNILNFFFFILMIIFIIIFVVFIERGQRRIPITYPSKKVGKKKFLSHSSYLPLKINIAGVIPQIFASSVLLFIISIIHFFVEGTNTGWLYTISKNITHETILYIFIFAVLVIFFCFIYTNVILHPNDVADNLKKSGAYIPGIRPGKKTAFYINNVITRINFLGAIYLAFVSVIPPLFIIILHIPFYFFGTTILIVVMFVIELIYQIQSHLISYRYNL